MTKLRESDLAKAVMDWLSHDGWDCYPEAQFRSYGRRVDIAAVRGRLPLLNGVTWFIECKTSLSTALLDQAYLWIRSVPGPMYISVATPSIPGVAVSRFCRTEGIGIILVGHRYVSRPIRRNNNVMSDEYDYVTEKIGPRLQRHNHKDVKTIIARLHVDMKRFAPGSTAGEGFSTPWRRTMDAVYTYLQIRPGATMKQIIESVKTHYRVPSTARSCLAQWLYASNKVIVDDSKKPFLYSLKDIRND